jgi:pimeloyl-ACP methyl ester carboxylesterase
VAEPGYGEAHAQMMKTMGNVENRSRFNLLRRLPHVTAPTFFLLGRHDPTSEHAEELVALCPGSKSYVIETGGHQIHYENQEEFSQQVLNFLG